MTSCPIEDYRWYTSHPSIRGQFVVGAIVVTLTDMVSSGGSNGNGPCKDTIGSRVAAKISSSGLGSANG